MEKYALQIILRTKHLEKKV